MSRPRPYQTLIFRSLHAGQGSLAILGVLTGYWLLNTWDPHLSHLPLPTAPNRVIDLHDDIGGLFTGALGLFVIYSVWAGRRRLVQSKSLKQLAKVGKPIWWYTLHRIVNTSLLLLGGLVVISGEALDDDAMVQGISSDWAYGLHVFAWLGIVVLTVLHVLLSLKVGGIPLLRSVVSVKVRPKDWPKYWPQRLWNWLFSLNTRCSKP
ncbi:MAG: cytochrome b/b6 domain-containing protein [Cyanobacteria bacterium J06632_22]